jgi:uncharacterized RDD family membrane protein YckC
MDTQQMQQTPATPVQPIESSGMQNQQLVGFVPRLLATLIDGVVLFVVGLVIVQVLGKDAGNGLSSLINFVYPVAFLLYNQQSLGKMALKIKVVREDGKKVDLFTAIMREVVGKIVSALPIGLGFLWVLWDPKKQGFHDKIARTLVVKA